MKKFLGFFCLAIFTIALASCTSHPQEPLVVKTNNILQNPVNYDRTIVAIKGQVTAIGTQPDQQVGWYDLTDDTNTIRVITTPGDIPKRGDDLWVSGTFLSNENSIRQSQRVKISNFPVFVVVMAGILGILLIVLVIVLLGQRKPVPQFATTSNAPSPGSSSATPPPPPSSSPPPPPPPPSSTPPPPPPSQAKSSSTMMDSPKPRKTSSETFIEEGQSEPVLAYLIVKSGSKSGSNYPLKKSVIKIGREQGNDIVIDDKKSSREHAKLKMEDSKFVVYDLASSNGTYVNGEKIQSHSILDSDEIQIGDTVLVFKKV